MSSLKTDFFSQCRKCLNFVIFYDVSYKSLAKPLFHRKKRVEFETDFCFESHETFPYNLSYFSFLYEKGGVRVQLLMEDLKF